MQFVRRLYRRTLSEVCWANTEDTVEGTIEPRRVSYTRDALGVDDQAVAQINLVGVYTSV